MGSPSSHGRGHLGVQYLLRRNFLFMFFKCLSKLQTSGARQSGPVPLCPGSPAFCRQDKCQGEHGGQTSLPHQAAFVAVFHAFLGVSLSKGFWSRFRESVQGPVWRRL